MSHDPEGDQINGMSSVQAVNAGRTRCKGSSNVEIVVQDTTLRLWVIVIDHVVGRIDVVMGMDAINCLGGVSVGEDMVSFGGAGA